MRQSEWERLKEMQDKGKSTTEILEAAKPRRMNGHKAPKGGISIRAAARKYGINYSTLSRWAKRGWVNIIQRTANWTYIDEKSLVKAIESRMN